jgi:hypothetical protein
MFPVIQDVVLVGVGNGADAIHAALPQSAVDYTERGDLLSGNVRGGAKRFSGTIRKAIDGYSNLGGSPLGSIAFGLALGLVVVGGGKSRTQRHLRVVVIARSGNDVGNEMVDSSL